MGFLIPSGFFKFIEIVDMSLSTIGGNPGVGNEMQTALYQNSRSAGPATRDIKKDGGSVPSKTGFYIFAIWLRCVA